MGILGELFGRHPTQMDDEPTAHPVNFSWLGVYALSWDECSGDNHRTRPTRRSAHGRRGTSQVGSIVPRVIGSVLGLRVSFFATECSMPRSCATR